MTGEEACTWLPVVVVEACIDVRVELARTDNKEEKYIAIEPFGENSEESELPLSVLFMALKA